MKIGITEYYLRRYGLLDGLRRMKMHGYECLECQQFLETDTELFAVSITEFEKRVREFGHIVQSEGIEIHQAHGPWRYPPRDASEEDRTERYEKMLKSVYGAAMLGCPNLVLHPLMPFGCGGDEPQKMRDINMEFMTKLCAEAQKCQVSVCLENMPMRELPIASPQNIIDFVREIHNPFCKACLDTGHSAVLGVQPADAVPAIGKEKLAVLHVHDNNGECDCHWAPFTGVVHWENFTKSLQDIDFNGSVSIETKIPTDIPEDEREKTELSLACSALKIAGR